jgi:hypothetical protein
MASTLSYDSLKKLVVRLRKCRKLADVHAVLNDSPHWCQNTCEETAVDDLFRVSKTYEYRSVIENVARMITGSGVTLVGGDNITDELVEHFERNVSEFVPKALNMMTVLGFVAISWHVDMRTGFPLFKVANHKTSEFHLFVNKVTKAQLMMRWDTTLNIYDEHTEFFYVSEPTEEGEIDSLAATLMSDYRQLCRLRVESEREVARPSQYIIQKRPPKFGEDDQDAVDEALLGMHQELMGGKRKRDVLDTATITLNGERIDFLVVQDNYEIVGGASEVTGQFSGETWTTRYEQARTAFSRRLYQLMGVPGDITEERRRETGMARQAADQDFNRAAGRWARRMGKCINMAIQSSYPIIYMDDDETQRRLMVERRLREARQMINYIDTTNEDIDPSYENLMRRIRPPSPTAEDLRKLLADRIPTARMEPDRRLTAEEIQTIRESTAFDDDKTRRLEAQALGMADVVEEDEQESQRPRKKQRNLLKVQRGDDEESSEESE